VQNINSKQNHPHFVQMLKAADVAHARAERWERTRLYIALGSSSGAIIAAFVRDLAPTMAIIGMAGAVIQWVVSFLSQNETLIATKIQERFDVELFGVTHRDEFKPVPSDEEIGELASKFNGKSNKSDWYIDVSRLPAPYAIMLCQRENLQWDWRLRRKWANRLQTVALTWVTVGIAIALIADWSTRDLFLRWLVPSVSGLLLFGTLVVANRRIAREKQQLALIIDEKLSILPVANENHPLEPGEESELMAQCREYQSRIFRLRNRTERVPVKMYMNQKENDEALARAAASRLRERLLDL